MKKNNHKKCANNNKKEEYVDCDTNKDNLFSARILLGPNCPQQTIKSVKINKLDHDGCMTFDDVMFAVDSEIEKTFPEKSYPDLEVLNYLIFCKDTKKWYPVVSESDTESIEYLKGSKKYDRFLVLPDATYHLTPECKLWMKLKDAGLISENEEFDYKKMKNILNGIKE